MRVLVVHESMFGNTRQVAGALAGALVNVGEVSVLSVGDAMGALPAPGDLLVIGAPTHARSLPRLSTRASAPASVARSGGALVLEPAATGVGVREWLQAHGALRVLGAAFDTRLAWPAVVTGRAGRRTARELRRRGADVLGTASFLVDRQHHLKQGELRRAAQWGAELAALVRQVQAAGRS